MVALTDLVSELKTLRKGRGLFVSHIGERTGVALRQVCGVTEEDGPAEIRRKVATRLEALASGLPVDLRVAVMAAFAISQDARLPLYQDRVSWAADKLGRDSRTARRRIDEGIQQLAQLATVATVPAESTPADPTTGWHTAELIVAVALDLPVPEVIEHRRITSDQDELTELDLSMTMAGPGGHSPGELDVRVGFGGTLVRRQMESSDRFAFVLTLPRALRRGESYDYLLRYRLAATRMRPHFACVPRHPCARFDLRVRFGRDRLPAHIWLLRNVFQRDVDDPLPAGAEQTPDQAGEIHLTFRHLTPGLAYGARWAF